MMRLDPLVHHLHRQGTGSWAQFSRAVEAFDATLDPRSCARALAEHALTEFDFDNDRDWSVTTVQLVEADRYGTVAWGGTPRTLAAYDIEVERGTRSTWIDGSEFTYEHGVRIGKRGRQWPRSLMPIRVETILGAIPALSALINAHPQNDVPLRKAERLEIGVTERRNPGGFRQYTARGTWEPSDGVSTDRNATWKLGRATYMVSRNSRLFRAQPEIALWSGFLAEADRVGVEHLVFYDNDEEVLQVAAYPRLPIIYVRALLLCGARESWSDRRDKRVFRNVEPRAAGWFAEKLGISLEWR